MKKIFLLLALYLFVYNNYGQDKKLFDITTGGLQKSKSLKSAAGYSSRQIQNNRIEITLISGGYFTIGTSNGISPGKLDDNCAVTFGHPYALTSYPVFSVNGQWYKPDEYFLNAADNEVKKNGDTLSVTSFAAGKVSVSFFMISMNGGQSVKLVQKIVNLASVSQNLGLGLVIDPALGKWGDGCLETQSGFLTRTAQFDAGTVPSNINIWEKSSGAKGIGIGISFNKNPDMLIAANWQDVYKDQGPVFTSAMQNMLYDLDLKFYWAEETLSPLQEKICSTTVALLQPDFSSAVFLRWDLPNFLSLDNKILFPDKFNTSIEVAAENSQNNDWTVKLETPAYLSADLGDYNIQLNSSGYGYAKVNFQSHLVYEDKVVEAVARIYNGASLVDEIHRSVFIPATPVSDTGLVVLIDSLGSNTYPNIDLSFKVQTKETNYYITQLNQDNVFLYDNNQKINTFDLRKDLSGGVNSVDFVFVLDVTGSMGGIINSVKNNIIEFTDSLKSQKIDYQLGLVTFLDDVENIYPFTKDPGAFQSIVAQQFAHGGGDGPENSLQALLNASKFLFRSSAKHIIIWITDSNYHERDSYTSLTKDAVINALLASDVTVNSVGTLSYKSSYYDPIINPTGGNYYDINGNFRDIMLDMSRLKSSYKYLISFNVLDPSQNTHQIKLMIRYAGLGGSSTYNFDRSSQKITANRLSFYPNPFNPEVTLRISKGNYESGKIRIFNLLGQRVNEIVLSGGSMQSVKWNARNDKGMQLGSGFYIVQLILTGKNLNDYIETAKILYLK